MTEYVLPITAAVSVARHVLVQAFDGAFFRPSGDAEVRIQHNFGAGYIEIKIRNEDPCPVVTIDEAVELTVEQMGALTEYVRALDLAE